jgi:hypothetical protein
MSTLPQCPRPPCLRATPLAHAAGAGTHHVVLRPLHRCFELVDLLRSGSGGGRGKGHQQRAPAGTSHQCRRRPAPSGSVAQGSKASAGLQQAQRPSAPSPPHASPPCPS